MKIETPEEIIKRKQETLIKNIVFVIVIGIVVYLTLYVLIFDPNGNNYKRNEDLNVHYDLNKDLIPAPVQTNMKKLSFVEEVRGTKVTISKIAEYDITGKVEALQYYNTNAIASLLSFKGNNIYDYLSPLDLTLTWGELALKENSGHITMDQYYMNSQRIVWWKCDNELLKKYDKQFINSHLSNNHLISLNNGIRSELAKVKIGQIVRIKGFLVGLEANDGSHWGPSSISRTDEGNGACEIILIEDFLIMK